MKPDILLETKDLSVVFPLKKETMFEKRKYLRAVSGVSLEIHRGETFGLVGESGCGKSTFANTTLGLQKMSGGTVIFDGLDLGKAGKKEARETRLRMQKVFQDPAASLNPRFTVFQAVSEPMRIRGTFDREEIRERTREMIRAVGLGEEDLKRYTSEFSGGQQQRIAIARALMLRPDYIVCDEPVSALDVSVHAQILNLLMEMQRQTGVTYLFISHNLAVVRRICSRLAIMYGGRIVEYGDADRIFANPLHSYTKALLSAELPLGKEEARERMQPEEYRKEPVGELTEAEENHWVARPPDGGDLKKSEK